MTEEQIRAIMAQWPIIGGILVALIIYHKPILAMLQRTTRDPLVEALAEQNRHFADNNKLFQGLGPVLSSMDATLKTALAEQQAQTQALHDLLAVQRHILTETKVAAEIARARKS